MANHEISNNDSIIDVRDIIARIEELEDEEYCACDADAPGVLACIRVELAQMRSLMNDIKGYGGSSQWRGDWYPGSLTRDSYFVEAMKELCEDIGDMPRGFPSYLVIDWNATADNLRVNYSSVEFDGVTYWYR
jgi:hypothetical protein